MALSLWGILTAAAAPWVGSAAVQALAVELPRAAGSLWPLLAHRDIILPGAAALLTAALALRLRRAEVATPCCRSQEVFLLGLREELGRLARTMEDRGNERAELRGLREEILGLKELAQGAPRSANGTAAQVPSLPAPDGGAEAREAAELRRLLAAARAEAEARGRRSAHFEARARANEEAASAVSARADEAERRAALAADALLPLQKAAALAEDFYEGQRNFLSRSGDIGAAGSFAFLITHSLLQLAASALAENGRRRVLEAAMLGNLWSIASRRRGIEPFRRAQRRLEQLFPEAARGEPELAVAPGEHLGHPFFINAVQSLRAEWKIDLAPFYFAVDEHGKVFKAE